MGFPYTSYCRQQCDAAHTGKEIIQRNEAYDRGALLIALKRIGLTPTIAFSG
jgi:hypothetical protein